MNQVLSASALVQKYNRPLPRYTSYPTVPNWDDTIDADKWTGHFQSRFDEQNPLTGLALYIHLPFCESLCTYCGCNKKITTNHSVEEAYLDALKKEWLLYAARFTQAPVIRELHLGGGTPTFFSPPNLKRLLEFLLRDAIIPPQREFSFEGHPNNTTRAHLQTLYDLGFRRVSFGVQDNDPEVQRMIHRIQPLENLVQVTHWAREIGYDSVNYDLIYGLPLQTEQSMARTFREVLQLRPDRIAFYSYAHVPWTSKAQRLFDESDLPAPEQKLSLYNLGKTLLLHAGYTDIGMDHFALPDDALYQAWKAGRLHRNFMGYTTQATDMLLGLGVSAISDCGDAFAQNTKTLHDYYARVEAGTLPLQKGYFLSPTDLHFRRYIQDLACKGHTEFQVEDKAILQYSVFPLLEELKADGLADWNEKQVWITETGHAYIRPVCSAFDLYLRRENKNSPVFSQAI